MNITIIGWYGTETIGDRAIFTGLLSYIDNAFGDNKIKLGSLYPFFTRRTLEEDFNFYKEIFQKDIIIEVFNSKCTKELDRAMVDCDLVAMGGGPLMDLSCLYMVEYAFQRARRNNIKTAILGCGVGPLFKSIYRKTVLKIIKNSDITILRDQKSQKFLSDIFNEFNQPNNNDNICSSIDPAVECAVQFNKMIKKSEKKYIAINLREFPANYSELIISNKINQELIQFVSNLALKYCDREILMIPMHYFHIGDDDRIFMNKINFELQQNNIKVQNKPLTLKETINTYQNAYFNIGMRFHSVVLQTISSGKNYIIDYTEPKKGKINGFINDMDKQGFYKNRYVSLQQEKLDIKMLKDEDTNYNVELHEIYKYSQIYVNKLRSLF